MTAAVSSNAQDVTTQTSSLDSLEARITQAVTAITDLRRERESLRAELAASRAEIAAIKNESVDLQLERDELIEERATVAQRLGDLVGRLDAIEQI